MDSEASHHPQGDVKGEQELASTCQGKGILMSYSSDDVGHAAKVSPRGWTQPDPTYRVLPPGVTKPTQQEAEWRVAGVKWAEE